jgi:hypothetical protein
MYLTLPVNILCYLATSLDTCHVALTSWAVLIEEQLRGTGLLDLGEYLSERFWTIEKQ